LDAAARPSLPAPEREDGKDMIELSTISSRRPDPEPPRQTPLPYYDEITRYTAAAAYLVPWLSASILFNFFGRPRCAWGPSVGVDPVAVVRHAVAARRIRWTRDAILIAILLLTLATIGTRLVLSHGFRPAATTMGSLAALVLTVRLLRGPLRKMVVTAWTDLRKKPQRLAGWVLTSILGLFVLGRVAMGSSGPRTDIAIGLAGVALAWIVLIASYWLSFRRAARVRRAPGAVATLARPLDREVEDRLREVPDANVVVYGRGRADLPFLGSGQRIRNWKLEVDVTVGAKDEGGHTQEPLPFNDVELNRYLDQNFVLEQSDRRTCLHRLYVDGRTARPVDDAPDEWPAGGTGPLPHPVQLVNNDLVLAQVCASANDRYRRVYFCLQETARNGDIVVSLFVRPHLRGRVLFIEIALHALLPLDSEIVDTVNHIGTHRIDIMAHAVRAGTRSLPRMLLGGFGRAWHDVRRVGRQHTQLRTARRAIRRDRQFDFGSPITLREGISTIDIEEMHYNALMDIVAIGAELQNRLLGVLREFLVKHHIDTAEFDQTKQSIVNHIQTWNVGQVVADMVGFGNNNDFNTKTPASGGQNGAEDAPKKGGES
jgi:hypothetical protein